jgi:DNA-binding response OmpR family regulator
MSALLLSTDLMISSRVAGAAARSGMQLATVGSAQALLERACTEPPALVILDLTLRDLNPADLVPKLKAADPAPRVIAFGPHVHEERLQAAADAGCDAVLARGQFVAQIDALLQSA